MNADLTLPIFDRDEYYEASARTVRWICLVLILITYPFTGTATSLIVITVIALTATYNALRHLPAARTWPPFTSRLNSLTVDHIFVLAIVFLTGGLASPYYPLFFLLIIATIASFGIAGFAFSLSAQVIITLLLLRVSLTPAPSDANFQFIIKLALLIIFSLVAEQAVRSRDQEHLLERRFAHGIENERQRLLSLINSLSSAVLALDDHGNIYLYNAAALELLNTNRDITGHPIGELLPLETEHQEHISLLHLLGHNRRPLNRQDLVYAAKDGSRITLDLTLTPVRVFGYGTDNWGGYIVVFRDITKQKSLDEERDEFIAVTSHELRTPLAIAEANLSTAMLPGFARIPDKARDLLEQAHTNIVFLSQLIQDLTTLSRAERDQLKLSHDLIDAKELIEELARDYRDQAKAKGLKLEVRLGDQLGSIVTSRPELHEMLQNFITNAIKYTPNGTITLAAERTKDGVEFSVRDTGIGVSASDKTKIFAKFYRSEDYRTRATGGTGLGLYITRKLAEKLGAHITFTSRLNHGSTFRLLVPFEPPATPDTATVAPAQPNKTTNS